jgi:hypothetical protein
MDINDVPFGVDFRKHIQAELADSQVLFAIVGNSWLGPLEDGYFRIADQTDFVRIEVETAARNGTGIIPVLINNATMPKPEQLPNSLKFFSFLNAAPLTTGRDFNLHMERLIRSTDQALTDLEEARRLDEEKRRAQQRRREEESLYRVEKEQQEAATRRVEGYRPSMGLHRIIIHARWATADKTEIDITVWASVIVITVTWLLYFLCREIDDE